MAAPTIRQGGSRQIDVFIGKGVTAHPITPEVRGAPHRTDSGKVGKVSRGFDSLSGGQDPPRWWVIHQKQNDMAKEMTKTELGEYLADLMLTGMKHADRSRLWVETHLDRNDNPYVDVSIWDYNENGNINNMLACEMIYVYEDRTPAEMAAQFWKEAEMKLNTK